MTEQESRRGKSRRERVEFARSRDILDVANELQMELFRSGRDYRWKEHDSLVISPDKNLWKWFSRNTGGDAISLVETIKEVDFNQSVDFLNDGNFKEFQMVERPQEDFKYYLEKYEQPLSAGRDYLRNQRGLSDETIDYFLGQGILAQANAKLDYFVEGNGGNSTNAIEPVIVFKSLSSSGEVVGASLQGIQENWEKWPKHGYAKVIMKNSDPMTGIHVDIGSPKRLIFTEKLAKLQEGEAVILRGVKGRDNAGRKVTTDPIFAHDKNSFPYKYMFLQEEFDTSMTLADIPVESAHRELELQEIAVDAGTAFNNIIDWRQRLTMPLLSNNGETPKLSGRHSKGQKVQSQSFTSTDELFQAAVASVIHGDYDYYDDGDDFFADEVI